MTVLVCSPNIQEKWKMSFIIQFTILCKKCSVVFCFQSFASTPRLLPNGCRATIVLFKVPERAPKHGVSIPHSHLDICPMTSIFWWNWSKTHSHNKLNERQQLLWFWFAFITRSMDQTMATKSLSANKTAENTPIWKSPNNALQAQYWINVRHVCEWFVSLLMYSSFCGCFRKASFMPSHV